MLHSLNLRFDRDRIYTFTGPILIAVNPFKNMGALYSSDMLSSYLGRGGGGPVREAGGAGASIVGTGTSTGAGGGAPSSAVDADAQQERPHVYATAAASYRG